MLRSKTLCCLFVLCALVSTARSAGVPTPAPSFTISASNVTMPPSGTVAIPFTLTSVNGFVGTILVQCVGPTEPAGVRAPYCEDYGPARLFSLAANGTATGVFEVVAKKPNAVPAVGTLNLPGHTEGAKWAMAGALLLGLGLRKRWRRIARTLLMTGALILAETGLSGCGGPPTLTPGAYVFTLNANSTSNGTEIPEIVATTTATVTVPAGIVTDSSTN